ncbi:thioesterase II family protein [Pseudonocardia endophytica]|uniref:Pyochelin biosynthetic protein PchC n=1 Tax=Pseudonocardia endophytica TaxID=401976 RepID=A0A4R1HXZ3_PSEEN|nr:alpha/beta fold hydrolase [Pseudonocardia endophytica]TCK25720.1 pyochelin biosynthetic protein PchC [Pseudonocardia endophytica]
MTGRGWLRCYRPQPAARVRLVCFPHAGGSASWFRNWPQHLPDAVELHAVQYPGREDRFGERCPTDMAELADAATDALGPLLDRPVALFGHSMGAAVAFEVAARLGARGRGLPMHLFASARHAPHDPSQVTDVHLRDDTGVVDELRRLGGTVSPLLDDPDLLPLILPAVRADHELIETYLGDPRRVLDCPLTVLLGTDDTEVTPEQARRWDVSTRGTVDIAEFPGGHFYLADVTADVVTTIVGRLGSVAAWPSTP